MSLETHPHLYLRLPIKVDAVGVQVRILVVEDAFPENAMVPVMLIGLDSSWSLVGSPSGSDTLMNIVNSLPTVTTISSSVGA